MTNWCTFFNSFTVLFLSNIPRKRTLNHNKPINVLSFPRDCNFLFNIVCFIKFFFLQNVCRGGLWHKVTSPGIIYSLLSSRSCQVDLRRSSVVASPLRHMWSILAFPDVFSSVRPSSRFIQTICPRTTTLVNIWSYIELSYIIKCWWSVPMMT